MNFNASFLSVFLVMTNVPKSFTFIHHATGMMVKQMPDFLSMIQSNHMLDIFTHLTHRKEFAFLPVKVQQITVLHEAYIYIYLENVCAQHEMLPFGSIWYIRTHLSLSSSAYLTRQNGGGGCVFVCVCVVKYVKSQNLPLHAHTQICIQTCSGYGECVAVLLFLSPAFIHPPAR